MSQEAAKKMGPLFMGFFPQIIDDKLDPWWFLEGFQDLRINPHFLKTSFICLAL